MKKYLFAGFITLFPIALTIIVVLWIFELFTDPFAGLAERVVISYESQLGFSLQNHEVLVFLISRIVVFIFLFVLILLLGFFGRKFFFKLFLRLMDKLFLRIPIIKTIYHLINEITKSVFSQDKKTFKQTVLLPFPNDNSHAIGFVTGPVPEAFKKASPTSDLSVFVPTSPQPISGFLLITPKQFAYPVDVSIEDAFKFLLSCGVMHPGETPPSEEKEKKG